MRKLLLALSVTLYLLFIIGFSLFNSVPKAVVKQIHAPLVFPEASQIKAVIISSDGAASLAYVPDNQTAVTHQVLGWLRGADPVSVQLPKLKTKKQWITNAYEGPSTLLFKLKNNENIVVSPTFYIWNKPTGGIDYHYVDGVIRVGNPNSNVWRYYSVPPLYTWLENDSWKKEFHVMSG